MADREAQFIEAYLANGHNAKEAAITVGYAESTAAKRGSEMLQRPAVRTVIAKRHADIAEEVNLTVADVVAGLYEEATFKGEGSSHSARVSAWTAVGKHLGMFDKTPEDDRADAVARMQAAKARAQAAEDGKVVPMAEKRRKTA
jgi:phage terminase small subunit